MPPRPFPSRPRPATVIDLDDAASAMLDILVELGHLDDRLLDLVNDRLLDQDPADGRIHLDAVRRVVAEVLWDNRHRLDSEQRRIIDEEWGLLFY